MQVRRVISSSAPQLVWLGPVAILVLGWLFAAYRAGGYQSQTWLPLALIVASAGLVAASLGAYAGPPSRWSLAVLFMFACYAVWAALSAVWGIAPGLAWEEAAKAGFYLVFFALALTYISSSSVRPAESYLAGRTSARGLLVAAGLAIVAVTLHRLVTIPDLSNDFFVGRRFAFPLTYANGAGTFYLLLFWPLLWLAAVPRARLLVRATAVGTMTALAQLALLTQSRGAFAALLIGGVLYFFLSPARVRSLIFLVVPAALVAVSWSPLNSYYTEGALMLGSGRAVTYLAGSWVIATASGLVFSLVDGQLRVSSRLRLVLSLVIVVALLAGATYGMREAWERVGDPSDWAIGIASDFVGDEGGGRVGSGETRFNQVGGNGRWDMWQSAWRSFRDAPILGNGLGSYRYLNERYRESHSTNVRQSHSIELDLLSETGLVGFVLFVGTFGLALGAALAPRFRSLWALIRRRRPLLLSPAEPGGTNRDGTSAGDQAWTIALLAGVAAWFAHASIDWLWQFPGVTLGALLLLAWALSPARAGETVAAGAAAAGAEAANLAVAEPAPEPAPESAPEPAPEPAPVSPRRSGSRRVSRQSQAPMAARAAFRAGLAVVSLAAFLGAGLPYLSLRYQDMALVAATDNPAGALGHATTAERLFAVSPEPLLVRADVYRTVAATQPEQKVEALALALVACEDAVRKEDAASRVHQLAGQAALDLLAARASVAESPESAAGSKTGSPVDIDGSLDGALPSEREAAEDLLTLSQDQLRARALAHLRAALERNPLEPTLKELISAANGD